MTADVHGPGSGQGEGPRRAELERLQQAIDDSLRRTFAPPTSTRPLPLATPAAARGRARLLRWAVLAAAAALMALVALRSAGLEGPGGRGAGEREHAAREARGTVAPAATEQAHVAGLQRVADEEALLFPDLERLYSQAVQRPPTLEACISPEELRESGADRRAMLSARYGEGLRMKPEADTLLQGPFPSSEWPSGTIFTAHGAGAPAVLIAERSEHVECCVRADLPERSDLRVFTWTLGDLHLTEVTPLDEPHLIALFEQP